MDALSQKSSDPGRDPVCSCIENCLCEFAQRTPDRLKRRIEGAEVHLSFGGYSCRAINYDIALVRLAMAMLDDGRYGDVIRRALDPQIEVENQLVHRCAERESFESTLGGISMRAEAAEIEILRGTWLSYAARVIQRNGSYRP